MSTDTLSPEIARRLRPLGTTIQGIVEQVAAWFCVSQDEIMSHSRMRKYAWPRHVAMSFALEMGCGSTLFIGKQFNRDHSSVIYAARQVRDYEQQSPQLAAELNQLRTKIKEQQA